ncbi:MAG: hypothetical protein JNL98_08715 [Bryobacterales bacterium]|nr:hypothetical protein [Bryobacterales bacterium]
MFMRTVLLFLGMVFGIAAQDKPALSGLDPVLLTEGREVSGDASLGLARKGYLYHFANAATRARFEVQPERFEVQFDGACGKMGPGSGQGSPDRFAVHDGRIYIFASDSCRRTFLANPENHIERPLAPPSPKKAESARGEKMLAQALKSMGGEKRIDSIRSMMVRGSADPGKAGAKPNGVAWGFEGATLRRETDYPGWGSAIETIEEHAGTYQSPSGTQPMTGAGRNAVRQEILHQPLLLLRARKQPGFAAWERSGNLHIFFEAVQVEFTLKGGQIVSANYRGRGPGGPLGKVHAEYSGYREVDGLVLPHRITTSFNENPWPGASVTVDTITLNQGFAKRN